MKVIYTTPNQRLTVEVEGETQMDVFKGLASFQEVFVNTQCGKCNGSSVMFVVRENNDENEFPELHCQGKDCRARLTFGQHKKGGTLFPHRKDETGEWLPNNGWIVWVPETK